jgi:hypothetical protein
MKQEAAAAAAGASEEARVGFARYLEHDFGSES